MRIISFIDQPEVSRRILEHLGLWEESHSPSDMETVKTVITFDPSYSQLSKLPNFEFPAADPKKEIPII